MVDNALKTMTKWGFVRWKKKLLQMIAEVLGDDWFMNFQKMHDLSIKKPHTTQLMKPSASLKLLWMTLIWFIWKEKVVG